mmetsp:Transcript_32200/g.75870  ORF Transcript_32200/g.75870 Transcript_32200/m.75870 type:complete len:428 (+) Transcript_32200:142-1425(+)
MRDLHFVARSVLLICLFTSCTAFLMHNPNPKAMLLHSRMFPRRTDRRFTATCSASSKRDDSDAEDPRLNEVSAQNVHGEDSFCLQSRRDVVTAAALFLPTAMLVPTPAHAKKKKGEDQATVPAAPFVPGQKIPLAPVLGTCCPCPVGGSVEFSDEGSGAGSEGTCDETFTQVTQGIGAGYRWVDTATHYNNEKSVGLAIRQAEAGGDVKEGEVQAITKVWFEDLGYQATRSSCRASLARLGSSSLGAVLVHFPGTIDSVQSPGKNKKLRAETWRALEDLKKEGKIRYIGVSNYVRRHLKELLSTCEIRPDIAEMELHPYFQQRELVALCKENGIQVVGFSPFAHGELGVLEDTRIAKLALKHTRTPPQVILKWLLQEGLVPVVKASSAARMAENFNLQGFELDQDDMAAMRLLDSSKRVGFDPNQIA